MSEHFTARLYEPTQAHGALRQAWEQYIKPLLSRTGAPPMVLEVRPQTRSDAQNKLLHAMLGDIADQIEWAGAKRDAEVWKRLLTAAWLRARGESVEVLPAIDGHGVDVVFRRTSKLTRSECVELCDFIAAWAIERGVEFTGEDAQ